MLTELLNQVPAEQAGSTRNKDSIAGRAGWLAIGHSERTVFIVRYDTRGSSRFQECPGTSPDTSSRFDPTKG